MKIKLGISYWGFCEELEECSGIDTPDGGRYTRPILMKKLHDMGHELWTMQKQRGKNTLDFLHGTGGEIFPDIDALFIEWRWPTYKNDKTHPDFGKRPYEPDWDRQREIMKYYGMENNVPIVIFDTDLKILNDDFDHKQIPNNITIFEPAIHPHNGAKSLLYWSDFEMLFDKKEHNNSIVYLGSNYERYWAVDKYYYYASEKLNQNNISVKFFGNWLDKSPERPNQDLKVNKYSEYIDFYPRNTMQEGFEILSQSITTLHIGKKKYMDMGVLTPRYLESIVCGVPALVPEEFNGNPYGNQYRVNSYMQFFEDAKRLSTLNKFERRQVAEWQAYHICNKYDVHVNLAVDKIINEINIINDRIKGW